MAKRKREAARRPHPTKDEVQAELRQLALYLSGAAQNHPAALIGEKRRLRRAAGAIYAYLRKWAPSLDHAFGLVRPPGNPGGHTPWEGIAADADRRGLTTSQLIAELPASVSGRDEATVRENRKRGRAAYHRTAIQDAVNRAYSSLEREQDEERKARIKEVRRFNRRHGIKPKR
ncbi:MAG TPA: hypothetical protein VFB13_19125 [Reyranella sp.]|nr:hypothetical protein [Reyranella sp.]